MSTITAASSDEEPDWAGIRAASVVVGVREAARQAAKHLPTEEITRFVERVMKRCSREGWISQAKEYREAAKPRGALSANVRTGAEIVQDTLLENSKETKLGLTAYAARMAKQASETGTIEEAPLYKAVADIHGKMFPEQQQDHGIHLSFFSISQGQANSEQVVDVEAEATRE